MAYRFMLEVPEDERKSAEIAIGRVPETQIVVSRESFPEGFDDPFGALTISSDHLNVVNVIYDWYRGREQESGRYRVVLNSGKRIKFVDHAATDVIAAIRRDQSWTEYAVPRIGDHVREEFVNDPFGAAVEAAYVRQTAEELRGGPLQSQADPSKSVAIQQVNYVAVNVPDLWKAERFYADLFDTDIVGRATRAEDGTYRLMDPDFEWQTGLESGERPTDTFLRNGPLVIALHHVGLGARMDRTVLDRVSIQVDGETYGSLRGKVLMTSQELLQDADSSFVFRDPFGVPWEITMAGMLPDIIRQSLHDAF